MDEQQVPPRGTESLTGPLPISDCAFFGVCGLFGVFDGCDSTSRRALRQNGILKPAGRFMPEAMSE